MRLLEGLVVTLCVGVGLSRPLHTPLDHAIYSNEQFQPQRSLEKRGRLQDAVFVTVNGLANVVNWAMGERTQKLTPQQKKEMTDISGMLDEDSDDFDIIQKCVEILVLHSRKDSYRPTTKQQAFEQCMRQHGKALPGDVRYPYPIHRTLRDQDIRDLEQTIDVTPIEDKEIPGQASSSADQQQKGSRSSPFMSTLGDSVGRYLLPGKGGRDATSGSTSRGRTGAVRLKKGF